MKHALVTTTINIPHNLEAYARDIKSFGPPETGIIIAGDKRTPEEIQGFCDNLEKQTGIGVTYLSPKKQEALAPVYSAFLGWNTIQRRNIAFLAAYKMGAEIIATIDDDNFWNGKDYFRGHGVLGYKEPTYLTEREDGWFNVCESLQTKNNKYFYPRGYSLKYRKEQSGRTLHPTKEGRTVVNAGLWVGEPDIDAATRLALAPEVVSAPGHAVTLAPGTKCPFNSQNTAFHRDILPAYCMVSGVGRYDDIIAAYVVKRIADHLGDFVRFGPPIVRQERNAHDLWKDFDEEREGMALTDWFVDFLYAAPLQGNCYRACTEELINRLSISSEYRFITGVLMSYRAWLRALDEV